MQLPSYSFLLRINSTSPTCVSCPPLARKYETASMGLRPAFRSHRRALHSANCSKIYEWSTPKCKCNWYRFIVILVFFHNSIDVQRNWYKNVLNFTCLMIKIFPHGNSDIKTNMINHIFTDVTKIVIHDCPTCFFYVDLNSHNLDLDFSVVSKQKPSYGVKNKRQFLLYIMCIV